VEYKATILILRTKRPLNLWHKKILMKNKKINLKNLKKNLKKL